jgi:hypothetical protein
MFRNYKNYCSHISIEVKRRPGGRLGASPASQIEYLHAGFGSFGTMLGLAGHVRRHGQSERDQIR